MSIRNLTLARLLSLPVALVSVVGLGVSTVATAASASREAASASREAASASRAATPHWEIVARSNSALTTVIAPDGSSAWALGVRAVGNPGSSTFKPAGEHWNGHGWTAATFPKAVASGIGCAGASSAGNVWAFAGATAFGEGSSYAGAL